MATVVLSRRARVRFGRHARYFLPYTAEVVHFILIGAVLTAACASPTAPELPPGAMQVIGTVQFFNLEGGFWAVRGDDGITYDPIGGLSQQFQQENLRVKMVARVRPDIVGIHMVGPLVEVLSIDRMQ